MTNEWRTVKVFISSTFRDMHSERDWLVQRVFPELRQRLEKYQVHLHDIDLRWGITEEQAENEQILELCLDAIDECRPFFIAILGERYGWVPDDPLENSDMRRAWGQAYKGRSITELEILWGALLKPEMRERAVFCLRNPDYTRSVPEEILAVMQAESQDAARKLARLKNEMRQAGFPCIDNYACCYAGLRINWRLVSTDLNSADREALERVASDGRIDIEEYSELDEHLKSIVSHYGIPYLNGLDEFGRDVKEKLWDVITRELGLDDSLEIHQSTQSLADEQTFHDRFADARLRLYVGKSDILQKLNAYADDDEEEVPCVVTGRTGVGKSAALANFLDSYHRANPDVFVLGHFIGASPWSTGLRQTLYRMCTALEREFFRGDEVPSETNSLIDTFWRYVEKMPADRRSVLVIDAIDQFDENDSPLLLSWLPWKLPPHVKIIMSCGDGPGSESLTSSLESRSLHRIVIEPLDDTERATIVHEVPLMSAKSLDSRQVKLLLQNPATRSPLFLLVALEELRGIGTFDQVSRWIELLPREGDAVTALFLQVIDRLEVEFDAEVVRTVLSYIASARLGLSDRELLDLNGEAGVEIGRSMSDLFPILRQLRPYLQKRKQQWVLSHRSFLRAVQQRYLGTEQLRSEYHDVLTKYFFAQLNPTSATPWSESSLNAISELPSQALKAGNWECLESALTDLRFVQLKCSAGLTYGLLEDYSTALASLSEYRSKAQSDGRPPSVLGLNRSPTDQVGRRRARLLLATDDASSTSNENSDFPRFSLIRSYQRFVKRFSGALSEIPEETMVLARNSAARGSVAESAAHHLARTNRTWIEQENRPGVDADDHHIIQSIPVSVPLLGRQVAFVPDGNQLICSEHSDEGGVLGVYDVSTGVCIRKLIGHHTSQISSVVLSSDGKTYISGSFDGTVNIWDALSHSCIGMLPRQDARIRAVAISGDGSRAITASESNSQSNHATLLRLWDLNARTCMWMIEQHTEHIMDLAMSPDGRTVVVCFSNCVQVWHLDSEKCVLEVEGENDDDGRRVDITSDSMFVACGWRSGCVQIWDVPNANKICTITGVGNESGGTSMEGVNGVRIMGDAASVVVGTGSEISVWDFTSNELLQRLELEKQAAHTYFSESGKFAVAVTPPHLRALDVIDISRQSDVMPVKPAGHELVVSTPSGSAVISRGTDNEAMVYKDRDLTSPTRKIPFEKLGSTAISHCGNTAVTANGDQLVVWSPLNDLHNYSLPTSGALHVALVANGRVAVTGHVDGCVRLWNLATKSITRILHGVNIRAVNATRLEKLLKAIDLGTLSRYRCQVHIPEDIMLESQTANRLLQGHTSPIRAVCFGPDGRLVASGGSAGDLCLWDVEAGVLLHKFVIPYDEVTCASFSPDGRRLIAGFDDPVIQVWDLRDFSLECELSTGHVRTTSISVSPDGRFVLSGGVDGLVRLHEIDTARQIAAAHVDGGVRSLTNLSANGWFAAGSYEDVMSGYVRHHDFDTPFVTPIQRNTCLDASTELVASDFFDAYQSVAYVGVNATNWVPERDQSEEFIAYCPMCGFEFSVAPHILELIRSLRQQSHVGSKVPSYMQADDENWQDPRLVDNCANCGSEFRCTPFVCQPYDLSTTLVESAMPTLSEVSERSASVQLDSYDSMATVAALANDTPVETSLEGPEYPEDLWDTPPIWSFECCARMFADIAAGCLAQGESRIATMMLERALKLVKRRCDARSSDEDIGPMQTMLSHGRLHDALSALDKVLPPLDLERAGGCEIHVVPTDDLASMSESVRLKMADLTTDTARMTRVIAVHEEDQPDWAMGVVEIQLLAMLDAAWDRIEASESGDAMRIVRGVLRRATAERCPSFTIWALILETHIWLNEEKWGNAEVALDALASLSYGNIPEEIQPLLLGTVRQIINCVTGLFHDGQGVEAKRLARAGVRTAAVDNVLNACAEVAELRAFVGNMNDE